jgi:hypothetical protein
MATIACPFFAQSNATLEGSIAYEEVLMATWIRYQTHSRDFGTDTALFDLDQAEAFEHNDGQGRENNGVESVSVFLRAHHFVIEKQMSPKAFQIVFEHMQQLEKQSQGTPIK